MIFKQAKKIISRETERPTAFVLFFYPPSVCLCMHVSSSGGRDLSGTIVILTPGWPLSNALASDPIHCGRQGLSLMTAGADKLGLELSPGDSGLPRVSRGWCQDPGLLPAGLPGAHIQVRLLYIPAGSQFSPDQKGCYLAQSRTAALHPEWQIISF